MEKARIDMEKLLTAHQLAEKLNCHPQSVYRNKELPKYEIPGVGIRYKEAEIKEFLETKSVRSESLLNHVPSPISFNLTELDKFDRLYLVQKKGGNSGSMRKKIRWNYGFGSVYIRKTKEEKIRWYADYQSDGKRVREVVKNAQTRSEAVLYLQEKVTETFNHAHSHEQKESPSFVVFAAQYLEDYAKLNKKSWKDDMYRLNAHLNPFFGSMKLDEISPLHIENYRAERLKTGVSKSTINRELTVMKKMYGLAIDWDLVYQNPVKKVKFFSEVDTLVDRILTNDEEIRLLEASSDPLKHILSVALNTGMRMREILSLEWCQVDLERKLIRVEKTKSGKTRFISLNSELIDVFTTLRSKQRESDYVFPNPRTGLPYKRVRRTFLGACKKAGINGLRFHDLRHTFASRLVEAGVDLITVKELLGHSTVRITERYTHPNSEQKKKAVEILTQKKRIKPEKMDVLAHICHTEKKGSPTLSSNDSVSTN